MYHIRKHLLLNPPLNPLRVPGFRWWFDATKLDGLAAGEAVAKWPGYNYNATQGTAGNRPTYQIDAVTGLPVVRFAASSSHWLALDNAAMPVQDHTLFAVVKANSTAAGKLIVGRAYFLGGLYLTVMPNNDATNPSKARYVVDGANAYSTVAGDSAWVVLSGRYDSINSEMRVNDGDLVQTVNAAGAIDYDVRDNAAIGAAQTGASTIASPFDGDMADLLMFDGALSDSVRIGISRYLGRRRSIVI